jgi:hypothetical protein
MADITPLLAIKRLENRDKYLAERIALNLEAGVSSYWLEQDRAALALAISALEYLDQVQEYEASQSQVPSA